MLILIIPEVRIKSDKLKKNVCKTFLQSQGKSYSKRKKKLIGIKNIYIYIYTQNRVLTFTVQ